jgi:hypothetical protein
MTLKELMAAMIAVYKGLDEEAVTAAWPAYRQKLEKFEGKELAGAWVEVVSGFSPTPRQPFPLPKDFEAVLPQPNRLRGTPAIDFKGHATRRAQLLDNWAIDQGNDLGAVHGQRVAFWCLIEARRQADDLAWKPESADRVWLSGEKVLQVIQGVVSRDRMDTFGWPAEKMHPEEWKRQMEECRGYVLAGHYSKKEIATPVQNMRRGPPAKTPVDLEPGDWFEVPEGDEAQAEP